MSDKRFAYWGMRDTGKLAIESNFIKNGKVTTFFRHHHYYTQYPVEKYDYGHKYERVSTYRKPNSNELARQVSRIITVRFDALNIDNFWNYSDYVNFVDERTRPAYQDDVTMNPVMFEDHADIPELKDAFHRVIDENHLIIQPERLLGFSSKEDAILDGINDLKYSFQEEITERLKNEVIHVIPYKTNLVDWTVNKLNFTDFGKWGFKNMFDAYSNAKLIVWKLLDNCIINARNLEIILKSRGISYQYFNMDEDSYLDCFGLDYEFPRNFTHLTYKVETGDVSWSEDEHNRYRQLLNIAEQYIHERNITDLRLDGADKDGIR